MIIIGLIKYIIAVVEDTAEDIISVDYKAIIEVLIEVYFKIIAKKNAIFMRS